MGRGLELAPPLTVCPVEHSPLLPQSSDLQSEGLVFPYFITCSLLSSTCSMLISASLKTDSQGLYSTSKQPFYSYFPF